jgi:hypothetical protein
VVPRRKLYTDEPRRRVTAVRVAEKAARTRVSTMTKVAKDLNSGRRVEQYQSPKARQRSMRERGTVNMPAREARGSELGLMRRQHAPRAVTKRNRASGKAVVTRGYTVPGSSTREYTSAAGYQRTVHRPRNLAGTFNAKHPRNTKGKFRRK